MSEANLIRITRRREYREKFNEEFQSLKADMAEIKEILKTLGGK